MSLDNVTVEVGDNFPKHLDIEGNKHTFLALLRSTNREGIEDLIKYLEGSSFFIDPASAKYHSNHPGGLCYHKLMVYKCYNGLCRLFKIQKPIDSIVIEALTHDLDKIGSYSIQSRNQKNEKTGNKWQAYLTYGYKEDKNKLPLSHGESSCLIANKYITLKEDEYLAIRHHMGSYGLNQFDLGTLDKAYDYDISVLLLHQADMLASKLYEFVYEPDEIPFNKVSAKFGIRF